MTNKIIIGILFIFHFNLTAQVDCTSFVTQAIQARETEGNYDKALDKAQEALLCSTQKHDSIFIGNSYLQIALALEVKSDYEKAEINYEKAYDVFSRIGNKERMASVCNNLAGLKDKLGQYSLGVEYARRAIKWWSIDMGDSTRYYKIAHAYNNAANNFAQLNALDSAIYYHTEAIQIIEENSLDTIYKYKKVIAEANYNLGHRYAEFEQPDFITSTKYYQEALNFYEMANDIVSIAELNEWIGLNKMEIDELEEASGRFEKAEQLLKNRKDSSSLSTLYYNWTLLYEKQNKLDEALEVSKLSVDFYNGGNDDFKDLISTNVDLIENLKKRNRNLLLFSIASLLFLVVAGSIWYYKERKNIRTKSKLIEEQRLNAQQEKELLIKNQKLAEAEREKIEKDKEMVALKEKLADIRHSTIRNGACKAQNLVKIYVNQHEEPVTASLDDLKRALNTLDKVIYFADLSIDEIMEAHKFGKPKVLYLFVNDMYNAAKDQCVGIKIDKPHKEDYEEFSDFKVKAEIQSILIDQVIGNAFDNIKKYADCDTASLKVRATSNKLFVEVEDCGVGFALDEIREGAIGIKSIREAVENERINGRVDIDTNKGVGTTVTVTIPNPFEK